jgi:ribosomal protein S18 acetylase RimI-like enzyme
MWAKAGAEPTHTDNPECLGELMSHDPGAVLLAEADGQTVGTIIAVWDGWRGSVYRLAVAPSHRRQGLARQLLRAAEERLTGLAVRFQAIIVETDDLATGFWQASGWHQQDARLRFTKG